MSPSMKSVVAASVAVVVTVQAGKPSIYKGEPEDDNNLCSNPRFGLLKSTQLPTFGKSQGKPLTYLLSDSTFGALRQNQDLGNGCIPSEHPFYGCGYRGLKHFMKGELDSCDVETVTDARCGDDAYAPKGTQQSFKCAPDLCAVHTTTTDSSTPAVMEFFTPDGLAALRSDTVLQTHNCCKFDQVFGDSLMQIFAKYMTSIKAHDPSVINSQKACNTLLDKMWTDVDGVLAYKPYCGLDFEVTYNEATMDCVMGRK